MTRTKKFFAVLAVLAMISSSVPSAHAIQTPSGMLLGVRAFATYKGLRIQSLIPGYSAEGVLFVNDVLLRASDGTNIYSIKNHPEIEFAKEQIGPNRMAALELWRPGVGVVYVWVEFRPIGGAPAAAAMSKAVYASEQERPGAKTFFHGGNAAGQRVPPTQQPMPRPMPQPKPQPMPYPGHGGGGNPADFFGRNF
jgi:hypothetical protein